MYELFGVFRTRTQKVIWALMEMDVEWKLTKAPPHDPQVLAINPIGTVPVLRVDKNIITDSFAILSFLADRENKLTYPAGSVKRAQQDALMVMAIDELDAPLWSLSRAKRWDLSNPELLQLTQDIVTLGFDKIANQLMDREYLMGDEFTIADIYTAHALAWARSLRYKLPQPVFDYYRRCYARPAAKNMREQFS